MGSQNGVMMARRSCGQIGLCGGALRCRVTKVLLPFCRRNVPSHLPSPRDAVGTEELIAARGGAWQLLAAHGRSWHLHGRSWPQRQDEPFFGRKGASKLCCRRACFFVCMIMRFPPANYSNTMTAIFCRGPPLGGGRGGGGKRWGWRVEVGRGLVGG